MQVVIELDEKLVAEIDAVAKDFNKNRLQYINASLQKSLQRDLGRKAKLSEEEIGQMYAEAYGKFPLQPDEFEIEDEQMEKFWKQV
jgi:metal-responsive CopG/Arc/MetJ family transcriptional regulator